MMIKIFGSQHQLTAKRACSIGSLGDFGLPPLSSVDARLKQLAKLPFSKDIDSVTFPIGFTLPKFNRYDAKTDAYTIGFTIDKSYPSTLRISL